MTQLKVLLAATGPISSARLSREIAQIAALRLVGHAADLSQAYILAEAQEPDIALIGPELMRRPEFEGLLTLFHILGTRWLEIDSDPLSQRPSAGQFYGTRAPPPAPPSPNTAGHMAHSSDVRSTHPHQQGSDRIRPGMEGAELLALLQHATSRNLLPLTRARTSPALSHSASSPHMQPTLFDPSKLVLIGASTGGIDALLTILSHFPADCPPTAIVQHTGAAFSASVIRLFRRATAAHVVPAEAGIPLRPGTIVIGAGCPGHLLIRPGTPHHTLLEQGPPISGHLPSVDALFQSARIQGADVVAALLTGMGRDGARGLLDLRQAGATTIAQDEASSVVYGMPKAAVELGAAGRILPLSQIAEAILSRCRLPPPA